MQPNKDSKFDVDPPASEFHDGFDVTKQSIPTPESVEIVQPIPSKHVINAASDNGSANPISRPRRAREATRSQATARLFWMLITAAIVMLVWRVGPKIIEEYQFALTAGKVRAEYRNAVDLLQAQPLENVSKSYQLVAQRIRPSVVSVKTFRADEGTRGQGSGVVMSKDGYILTNAHVVEKTELIEVVLYDRHRYEAELIGIDMDSDLAVVKINAPNLIPADWGDSEEVQVGSIVWAIGSPYGLNQTVTSGIISGKHRRDEQHQNRELFQTDAAVNPGNSGGPLVDASGHVIGINTSIYGETFQGISFAVPSVIARFVYQQLVDYGQVTRGFLGVFPETVFQDTAQEMNLPNLDGAVIKGVRPGSPAYECGLRDNDVILEWNRCPITVHTMLFRHVEMTPPNQTVSVVFVRDGELREVNVTVGDRNEFQRSLSRQLPRFGDQ